MNKPLKSFWKNKRVLITGNTGFKGSWLTTWLLTLGAKVWGYSLDYDKKNSIYNEIFVKDIRDKRLNLNYFNTKFGDINDQLNVSKWALESYPDIVFHLAAQPLVLSSYDDPIYTWKTNVIGTLNLLESLKNIKKRCAVVIITTDKVYHNQEWEYGYRENDQLGGYDPYSASKAGAEIATNSWRLSFCGPKKNQNKYIKIATARAGNVIGGGDWTNSRIIPDLVKATINESNLEIRNPSSKRPWQHVLEPLNGYIQLAESLYTVKTESNEISKFESAFNFGPNYHKSKSVEDLINAFQSHFKSNYTITFKAEKLHEARNLELVSDKAKSLLDWNSKLTFEETVEKTAVWYRDFNKGRSAISCCLDDIMSLNQD